MKTLINDIITITMNNRQDIDVYNIVIEKGYIKEITKAPVDSDEADKIIDGKNKIAMPGFINGHVHSDMTLARGLGDGLSLYDQSYNSLLFQKKWFKHEFNKEVRYYAKLLQYIESVKGGTTFLCDVPFWHHEDDLVKPFEDVGIKGAVVLDYRKDFLTGDLIEKDIYSQEIANLRNNGILPIIEAPAEEDFNAEILCNIKEWAEEFDTFIQMHLAETKWRMDIVKDKFNTTSIKFLDKLGFLSDRVIGSHGVYIDDEDMKILEDHNVKIINCPTSEMKIADGVAPITDFINRGIVLGLGTDGALWNDSADMFSEMKNLLLLQRVATDSCSFKPYYSLYAATYGGAKAFGLDREIGSIEKGKKANITILDYFQPHLIPINIGKNTNVLNNIVSCARAGDVNSVIIDGEMVVEDSKVMTVNEDEVLSKCQCLADEIFGN